MQFLNIIDMALNKIINLGAPTADTDAATKKYVDDRVNGLNWKDEVRAASVANITLTGPGATIDGVTMVNGDRFLAKDQTTGSQNGIYIWNGAAVAATRASDADTAAELLAATVRVVSGTVNANTQWNQTAAVTTIGTDTVTFVGQTTSAPSASETTAGIAEFATQAEVDAGTDTTRTVRPNTLAAWAGRKLKTAGTVGDGSATSFNIDHNFNTTDVDVSVFRVSDGVRVWPDIAMTTVNRVVLTFGTAPTTNQYRYVILG